MSWMVSVVVPSDDVDLVSSLLWDLGTSGIAETPTEANVPASLIAGFGQEEQADAALRTLTDRGFTATVDPYVADWAGPGSVTISRPGLDFTIEVGHAFGHGSHPTTDLCLDLLLQQLQTEGAGPCSVLDVGTGTGVLAIAAAAAGAQPVVAVENDASARAVAAGNIEANEVDITLVAQIDCGFPDGRRPAFDLLVANLLLADLRPLAPAFEQAARRLILSGFLLDQTPEVLALFDGWSQSDRVESAGWVGLVLERSLPRGRHG